MNLNEVLKDDWDQPRWETSNRGTCPAECSADLFLTDPTNETVNWNKTFDHSAISPPTVLVRKGPNRFRVAFNLESLSQKVKLNFCFFFVVDPLKCKQMSEITTGERDVDQKQPRSNHRPGPRTDKVDAVTSGN